MFVFLLLLLGVAPTSSGTSHSLNPTSQLTTNKYSLPISISGNVDFINQAKQNGWRGNGSSSNPYYIENLVIDGNDSFFGIVIQNTDLYFVINNTKITNCQYGIYIRKSSNFIVSSNTVTNSRVGLYLWKSNYGTLSGNTVSQTADSGIRVEESNYSTLSNNTVSGGNSTGIFITDSMLLNVLNNSVYDVRSTGIELYRGFKVDVSDNSVSGSYDGITVYNTPNSTVSGNRVSQSTGDGIRLSSSINSILRKNVAHDNLVGIRVGDSSGCLLLNNMAFNNSKYGITVSFGKENGLIKNIAFNNAEQFNLTMSAVSTLRMNLAQSSKVRSLSVRENSIGSSLNWTILDSKPTSYSVYKNSTLFSSGTWVSGFNSVNPGNISTGTYNLTVVFKNGYGDVVQYLVWVKVIPASAAKASTTTPTLPTSRVTTPGIPWYVSIVLILILAVVKRKPARSIKL